MLAGGHVRRSRRQSWTRDVDGYCGPSIVNQRALDGAPVDDIFAPGDRCCAIRDEESDQLGTSAGRPRAAKRDPAKRLHQLFPRFASVLELAASRSIYAVAAAVCMKPGATLTNPHAAAPRRKGRIHEWRSTRADEAGRRPTARRFGSRHRRGLHSETKGMILQPRARYPADPGGEGGLRGLPPGGALGEPGEAILVDPDGAGAAGRRAVGTRVVADAVFARLH
jgi:hypothetical protein